MLCAFVSYVRHMYVGAFRGQRSLFIAWNWSNSIARCLLGMLGPEAPGSL